MTNMQSKKNNLITPEKASIVLPTIISSIISLIIISTFVIPKYIRSKKVNSEYKEYLRKKDELPRLKSQYKIIKDKLKKLNNEKYRIINLVSGTSDLDTFLANLGIIGEKNDIDFLLIRPKSSIMFVDASNKNIQNELNINRDPLLVEGIKKYIINVEFNSRFENLLSFLRELEFQENIIIFSDISLENSETNQSTENDKKNMLNIKMKMNIYGKI